MRRILNRRKVIVSVGLWTFFFGFGAGALIHIYLLVIKSPLVLNFRGSLNFISSIFGDGIILPIVSMFAVSFMLENRKFVNRIAIILGLILGLLITIYFHVVQVSEKLVNWSMPTPGRWNFLGIWHALYMFLVASFFSLFYIILIVAFRKNKKPIKEALLVSFALLIFFILLRADYNTVNIKDIFPYR